MSSQRNRGRGRRQPEPGGSARMVDVKAVLTPLLVIVATSIGSVLAYVFTPLKEVFNAIVWEEKGEVLLVSQTLNPKQGDVVTIDIFVQPRSPVPLSEGVLTISYPAGLLRPGSDTVQQLTATTKKIDASTKLTQRPLEFIADAAGRADVRATLTTRSRTPFVGSLKIDVAPSTGQESPTRRNFSGAWNIDLGGIHGSMELKDVARTLTGSYSMSDGSRGLVEGTRDGKTFRVTFYRGGSAPSRYFIDAGFEPNEQPDLELRGKAKLLIATGDHNAPWREDRQLEYYAVARGR
jgi:hypothetical protein